MSLNPIGNISSALPYLSNSEVKSAFDKFIRQLNRDADDVGFEMSSATEHALKDMLSLINEIDDKPSVGKDMAEADMGNEDE